MEWYWDEGGFSAWYPQLNRCPLTRKAERKLRHLLYGQKPMCIV